MSAIKELLEEERQAKDAGWEMDYLYDKAQKERELCEICHDTGIVSRTEWYGTDDSAEVEKKCICTED